MASLSAEKLLHDGLAQLQLPMEKTDSLMRYLHLMQKWNKAINLTAITDLSEMVVKHVLDSLAVVSVIDSLVVAKEHATLLDVGSGGGLPGIPLAILRPTLSITLCESIAKKCAFLNQVKTTLGLENINVENKRVEELSSQKPFDVITARAVAATDKLHMLTSHLADDKTIWCLMKSQEETSQLLNIEGKKMSIQELQVPFLKAKRTVVLIHS